ncbi:hypothetical protein Aca07nite_19460 [Actinoplanes capillaceus]|uniref:Uncharacterized protein n=1 Tax=Actinoplanes campanulatus TaxID=113559 RepID=A0ABQ3WCB5_9ACTN|nr:hypothetical protein Aca07nite_19460 [Actinoplanes capillaceus]
MTKHRPLSDLIDHPVRLHEDPNRWRGTVVDATDDKVKVQWPDESKEWIPGRDVTTDV